MPLFNFALRPLADIQPWRSAGGPSLSWFGLSDGWFWIALSGQEILHVDGVMTAGDMPYVDYQVVRLWEDLITMLPAVLTKVPNDIAERLDDRDAWNVLTARARESDDAERAALGMSWWWERQLDNAYLAAAPVVHLWRRGDIIHVRWSTPASAESWTPVHGHATLAVDDFLRELRAFDHSFIAAMQERVSAIVRAGGIDGVAIDLAHLAHEQSDRSTWLELAIDKPVEPYDWNDARWILQQLGSH